MPLKKIFVSVTSAFLTLAIVPPTWTADAGSNMLTKPGLVLTLVSQLKNRRCLVPGDSVPSLRVSIIEQRVHVGRVKLFMLHVRKVSLDIGQVVVDAVTLCSRVDPQ